MRQIVCLSGEPWTSVPSRTQQLMSRMKDAEVLFFAPADPSEPKAWKRPGRLLRPGLIAYTLPPQPEPDTTPRLLARYSADRSARFLQSKLEKHRFREPILWCSTPGAVEYLDHIAYRGLIYDCYQDWPDFPASWESELTASADVVFAASPDLADHLAPCNTNVTLLLFGCNYPMFAKDDLPRPQSLQDIQGSIFGYAGTLWPDLDLTPVLHLASSRPDCTIVLVGRDAGCRQLPDLMQLPNVRAVGPVSPVDLPDYLSCFDACLYLLRRKQFYDDVIPSRLFEYLSSGKPVVAMMQPDQVEHFPDVIYGAHSPAEFAVLCSRALEETGTWARDRRREYGKAAAWSERAQQVQQILESISLFG